MKIEIIITSNRPSRRGGAIGEWFASEARKHGKFEVEVADLEEIGLPFLNEPEEPSNRNYVHQHTKDWSKRIESADAFVFVIPEYNNTPPASFINAIDTLYHEWNNKPCAFVAYGGATGGVRSIQVGKLQAVAVQMAPIKPQVSIQHVKQLVQDGKFNAEERHEKSGKGLLDELYRWSEALRGLR